MIWGNFFIFFISQISNFLSKSLGKTIQVISAIKILFEKKEIFKILIVVPLSLINNWRNEINKWLPSSIWVLILHGLNKMQRQSAMRNFLANRYQKAICISNYDQIRSDLNCFTNFFNKKIKWDFIVLDEGHKLKDFNSKTFQALYSLDTNKKLILTGTALQNNLKELYSLFYFLFNEMIFGSYATFKRDFEIPINRSRAKDATDLEKAFGQEKAKELRNIIKEFYLRRTKREMKENQKENK